MRTRPLMPAQLARPVAPEPPLARTPARATWEEANLRRRLVELADPQVTDLVETIVGGTKDGAPREAAILRCTLSVLEIGIADRRGAQVAQ